MGTKPTPPPRRDAPNASAALDRFFEVRLKPHVEGVARTLRRQFRSDLRAAVQVVVEAVAAAATATAAVDDEDDEDDEDHDDEDDAPPTKRTKRAAVADAGMDDVGVEDDELDHSHDLGDFSDDGVVSDAEGDETTTDEDDDDADDE